ncbi:MAG TPA: hypothetical protein DCW88_26425, partial [Agrobacterium sp.]|nr:hypothetical protein [Agrobacterium sp.]
MKKAASCGGGGLLRIGREIRGSGEGTPELLASVSQSPRGGATGKRYPGPALDETTLRYRV